MDLPIIPLPEPSPEFDVALQRSLANALIGAHWARFVLIAQAYADRVTPAAPLALQLREILSLDALWTFVHACRPRHDRERPIAIPESWRSEIVMARHIPGQGLCALRRFLYTMGLMTRVSLDELSCDYTARYCYPNARDAAVDLATWDGQGDPPGNWIKEKATGRVNPHYERDA